jgi:hypothetical protein
MVKELVQSHKINPLNAGLNPICHLLALLGAHHILHVSRMRVKGMRDAAEIDRLQWHSPEACHHF